MKKFLCLILLIVLCLGLTSCKKTPANKEDLTSKNVSSEEYFEWDGTWIVGYTELGLKQTELVIPAECELVMGLKENTALKSLSFANPDTNISSSAFINCTNLVNVELPANLSEIPDGVFYCCSSLKSIVIPEGVTEIGSSAFFECTSLEKVEFKGEKVKNIELKAFYKCSALKEIDLPDELETIENYTFEECVALNKVDLGKNLKSVGSSAFRKCASLKTVEVPEGTEKIDSESFAYCDALESISLPASLKQLEVSSIVQLHPIKVYVVKGSYADGRIADLMEADSIDKQYK